MVLVVLICNIISDFFPAKIISDFFPANIFSDFFGLE